MPINKNNENQIHNDIVNEDLCLFDIILKLDCNAIMRVLCDVADEDLIIALKNSDEEIQNKIFNTMSSRLATMLKEDIKFMDPVSEEDIIKAQQKIVGVITELVKSGKIIVSGVGDKE